MKINLYLIFLCLFNLSINAQNYPTIILKITDLNTNKSIEFIDSIIFVNKYNKFTYKELKPKDNKFFINKIKPGKYKIEITNPDSSVINDEINITYAANQQFYYKINPTTKADTIIYVPIVEPPLFPEYPGGNEKLIELKNKIVNKSVFKKFNNSKIYLSIVIDSLGNAKFDNFYKGIYKVDLTKDNAVKAEIDNFINSMDKWIPSSTSDGKKITSNYSIPLN